MVTNVNLFSDRGQPVIFVHGAINDYRSWQFQMEPFSRKYRAIAFSRRFAFPNKATGDVLKDTTIGGSTSDLAELIRKLELAPALVIGHPSGAFVGLYCAYKLGGFVDPRSDIAIRKGFLGIRASRLSNSNSSIYVILSFFNHYLNI